MIRHIVLMKPREGAGESEIRVLWQRLMEVGQHAPLVSAAQGENVSEMALEKGYRVGFTMDFVDADARDAYLSHPLHAVAAAELTALSEGGADGVLTFDLEI